MSSMSHVIATPELLEAVLLQLDLQTLLVAATLVNHYFHDVITKSVMLQRALFFTPDPTVQGIPHSPTTLNPLLRRAFYPWYDHSGRSSLKNRGYSIHSFKTMEILRDPCKKEKIWREDASWRRMLVQQPAVTTMAFVSRGFEFDMATATVRTITLRDVVKFSPLGLTMGALFDITQQRIGVAGVYASYYFRVLRSECLAERDAFEPDTIEALEESGEMVYEERGYYPTRVLGRDVDHNAWDYTYRHPAFQSVTIRPKRRIG
ncbi:hypothetical protein F4778DRAFT_736129 [Xylariomycetidae sp. FL2044]|nr:hypothetical protein F4778DRAFT_736129 [Xylariomycetidae sp. FL2044]